MSSRYVDSAFHPLAANSNGFFSLNTNWCNATCTLEASNEINYIGREIQVNLQFFQCKSAYALIKYCL